MKKVRTYDVGNLKNNHHDNKQYENKSKLSKKPVTTFFILEILY